MTEQAIHAGVEQPVGVDHLDVTAYSDEHPISALVQEQIILAVEDIPLPPSPSPDM